MQNAPSSASQELPPPQGGIIGHFSIFTTGVLLGFIPLFKSSLINDFSSTWIVFFRICIAFAVIALVIFAKYAFFGYREKFLISTKKEAFGFVAYGVICITAVNYFYIKSLTLTTATISVVTVFTVLPLTTLLVNFFSKEEKDRPTLKDVLNICAITIGCTLVTAQSFKITEYSGVLYAALAGFCYGLYSIVGKKVSVNHDYPVMMFWQFGIAAVSSIALLFAFENNSPILHNGTFVTLAKENLPSIFAIGFFATFLPYFLYSFGIKRGVKSSKASALTMMEPVSATLIAYVFLREQITLMQLVGITIVIFFSFKLFQK